MKNLKDSIFSEKDYHKIDLGEVQVVDVRAPIEFAAGTFPVALNAPVLDNSEREKIGRTYKQNGREAAIQLGYKIVSGENLDNKISVWKKSLSSFENPVISCFRGGLRSQTTQKFLAETGLEILRIEKGYKHYRQYVIDQLQDWSQKSPLFVLTGLTGSAKTHLIKKARAIYPSLDLEGLAHHRGSAFGFLSPQPSQAQFEINLWSEIVKVQNKFPASEISLPFLVEDESRVIGSLHQTEEFFNTLRSSPVIVVEIPLEERIENIFSDYILTANLNLELFNYYRRSLDSVEKRLGGQLHKEIRSDLDAAIQESLNKNQHDLHRVWIQKLLVHYYDRMYLSSFKKRAPRVLFRGSHEAILDFLKKTS